MSIHSEPMQAVPSPAPDVDSLPFSHSFGDLPPAFYTRLQPTPLPAPYLVGISEQAAALVGLDPALLRAPDGIAAFCGNMIPAAARPLSAVYSGHQFGVWAGQLGDGRAILLGELPAPAVPAPHVLELQLKGAGATPYSRMGDGRAVLRSSIREFLCSEAMAALGIATSRALCVTGSDKMVMRETPETTAVVTRMAPSFIRFGSFEHWYYADRKEELRLLADHVIDRFYPDLLAAPNPYQALLAEVCRRTAEMIAGWQAVGFMHGVMNTDNMSILGLTIDYGPFGFLDPFDPGHICNHSDHQGRYAWARQPNVAFWNLHALAQGLMPLIGDSDLALAALEPYKQAFADALLARWRAKLGLQSQEESDRALIDDLLRLMANDSCDFTITFRRMASFSAEPGTANATVRDMFVDRAAFDAWAQRYADRLAREASVDPARALRMNRVNPKFILRNHLAEVAIREAQAGEFAETQRLLKVLQNPFDEQDASASAAYADFPPEWAQSIEVSCSS